MTWSRETNATYIGGTWPNDAARIVIKHANWINN